MIENCFLLYVVNSRLKKFFCCLLQGIILSSQITNIYLTLYFSLVAICQWPLSSLRIPPDWLLCIPTRASPSQKFLPNPSRNKRFKRAPSKSDCKSNTFLLHHQTFYKLFYRKNTPTTTNTMIYTLLGRHIFFLRYRISYNITLLYRRYLTSVWQTAVSGYL